MLLLPALIFLSVTLGLAGLFFWFAPTKTVQRLQAMSDPVEKPQWTETVVNIVGPFAKLSSPTGNWEASAAQSKVYQCRHPA